MKIKTGVYGFTEVSKKHGSIVITHSAGFTTKHNLDDISYEVKHITGHSLEDLQEKFSVVRDENPDYTYYLELR